MFRFRCNLFHFYSDINMDTPLIQYWTTALSAALHAARHNDINLILANNHEELGLPVDLIDQLNMDFVVESQIVSDDDILNVWEETFPEIIDLTNDDDDDEDYDDVFDTDDDDDEDYDDVFDTDDDDDEEESVFVIVI